MIKSLIKINVQTVLYGPEKGIVHVANSEYQRIDAGKTRAITGESTSGVFCYSDPVFVVEEIQKQINSQAEN